MNFLAKRNHKLPMLYTLVNFSCGCGANLWQYFLLCSFSIRLGNLICDIEN